MAIGINKSILIMKGNVNQTFCALEHYVNQTCTLSSLLTVCGLSTLGLLQGIRIYHPLVIFANGFCVSLTDGTLYSFLDFRALNHLALLVEGRGRRSSSRLPAKSHSSWEQRLILFKNELWKFSHFHVFLGNLISL